MTHTNNYYSRLRRLWFTIALAGLLLSANLVPMVAHADQGAPEQPHIIISEIKLGGSNTTPSEYVNVFNPGSQTVDLSGWRLEYAKSSFDPSDCGYVWHGHGAATTTTAVLLDGTLEPGTISKPISIAMNNATTGAVHVIAPDFMVSDTVGWGSNSAPAPCTEGQQTTTPSDGSSLQRYLTCAATAPQDTQDNKQDFVVTTAPAPGLLAGPLPDKCQVAPQPTSQEQVAPLDTLPLPCQNIQLSEVLPNPAGSDTGHEFIEIHNTSQQSTGLLGCSLQTSSSSAKTYPLDTITLDGGGYLALSDTQTGLSLPNASGGTIWLLASGVEVDVTMYDPEMADDVAWAKVDGIWQQSYSPTPGSANKAMVNAPCPDGQIRNLATNRCITLATTSQITGSSNGTNATKSSSPTPCQQGQIRNPATGRCKKVETTVTTAPTACKPGQERNPETNRCRNITSTQTTAKACPTGQERNTQTNRCRKIATTAVSAKAAVDDVKDVKASSSTLIRWSLMGVLLAGAMAYAIFEWKQEIVHLLLRFVPKRRTDTTVTQTT